MQAQYLIGVGVSAMQWVAEVPATPPSPRRKEASSLATVTPQRDGVQCCPLVLQRKQSIRQFSILLFLLWLNWAQEEELVEAAAEQHQRDDIGIPKSDPSQKHRC